MEVGVRGEEFESRRHLKLYAQTRVEATGSGASLGSRPVVGNWLFYSSTCNGVYNSMFHMCGSPRKPGSPETAYCKGKSTRVLIAQVLVNADCPSNHPHFSS